MTTTTGGIMRTRHLVIAALAACALAMAASPAGATTAGYGTGAERNVLFVDGTDGDNIVHLTLRGSDVVVRDITGMIPGNGCRRSPTDADNVWCRLTPTLGRVAVVRLHGGNDQARVYSPAREKLTVQVWGGFGKDKLTAAAGARPTYLVGQADDDWLFGSAAGNEALWGGPGDDDIVPGGGADNIDGGHGDFRPSGQPIFRVYRTSREQADATPPNGTRRTYCESRSDGFLDRKFENDKDNVYYWSFINYVGQGYHEGIDDVWLTPSPGGALADLDVCRIGYFGTGALSVVHAIENVHGTRTNDRLVGDDENNHLYPGAGRDWIATNAGADRVDAQDGEVDTIVCDGTSGDTYETDDPGVERIDGYYQPRRGIRDRVCVD